MFDQPTLEDYEQWIDWHLAQAKSRASAEVTAERRRAAANGALQSSRAVILTTAAVRKEFEAGVNAVLGELKRAAGKTQIDPAELWQATQERLAAFIETMTDVAKTQESHMLQNHLDAEVAAFKSHLKFALRQFQVGFLDPSEPDVPPMASNTITIGNMTGSTIQQGSPNSTQQQVAINVASADKALADLEQSLAESEVAADTLAEMKADIQTIRAQMAKPSPSMTIVREAGKSLRNVVEGGVGGMLTPAATAAAKALWSLLGI